LELRTEEEAVGLLRQAYEKEERPDKKRAIRQVLIRVGAARP
jgi:hypothetical protein